MTTDNAFNEWINKQSTIDWTNPKEIKKAFIEFGDYAIYKYLEFKANQMNIRKKIEYTGFDFNWLLTINFNNELTVTKDGESWTYDLEYNITKITHDLEYVHMELEGGGFYQFKFEIDSFFVGDLYDKDGTHLDSFASHVFGEEN